MPADGADSSTASGAVIAGHEITGALKRDSAGAAFSAEAPDGTPVVLRLREARGNAAAVRFLTRAEAWSSISHPALSRVTGFGDAPEGLWVASAEVEGASLSRLLGGPISPMRAVRLLGEVADGIDAAHRAGLVHGDVRPENIIVQGRPVERATLVNFALGAAKAEPADDVEGLAEVLRECGLEPDPVERYETAGELIADAARPLLLPEEETISEEEPETRPAQTAPAPVAPAAKPPRRWPRRLLGAAAAVVVVGGAAAGGYAVSHSSAPDERPAPRPVSAGSLTIAVPHDWVRSSAGPGPPKLRGAIPLRRRDPSGEIVAGIAADRGAVLDPSRLAAEVGGRTPRPRRVRLGSLSALRFEGLEGRGPSVLYVASTSAGAPAVACTGPSVEKPCAEAARALSVRGARGYDPAAGIAWKNRVAAEARRFRSRRGAGLKRLRRATTPGAQAAAARQVARVHSATAGRLRRGDTPPQAAGARRRVLARLLVADRAFRSLARAARSEDEAAFRRAQSRVRRADRRLRVTLRSL